MTEAFERRQPPNKTRTAILAGITLVLLLIVLSPSGGQSAAVSLNPFVRPSPTLPTCRPLEDIISETYSKEDAPQLQPDQVRWIATELQSYGRGRLPVKFLVFGLGLDSLMWQKINCLGRSVFLENWKEWIDKILGVAPSLEAYEVQYNTTVGQADDFFRRGPWGLDVPQSVADDCYDVILVDAPQGYSKELPGRMQSMQLALDNAARCVASGQRRKTTIFFHDVGRPLEKRIIRDQLMANPRIWFLGNMKGSKGDLAGFEYSHNVRPHGWQPGT